MIVWSSWPARAAWLSRRIGWWMAVNMAGNCLWLLCFLYGWGRLWLSVAVIFLLILAPLGVVHRKLEVGNLARRITFAELVLGHVMVGVYMGWVSVASIVNVAIALTPENSIATLGWEADKWAAVILTVAFCLGTFLCLRHKDFAYAGTLAWALIAISKQQASPDYPGGPLAQNMAFGYGVALAAMGGAVLAVRTFLWWSGRTPPFLRPGQDTEDGVEGEQQAPGVEAVVGGKGGVRTGEVVTTLDWAPSKLTKDARLLQGGAGRSFDADAR
jgi:hypothetical protein